LQYAVTHEVAIGRGHAVVVEGGAAEGYLNLRFHLHCVFDPGSAPVVKAKRAIAVRRGR
jgi:hypothetical protein